MKRGHLINALVLAATGALIFWFVHNTHWEEVEEHTPMKGEALTNPFYSVQHFAESLGARTRLRHEIVSVPSPQAAIVLGFWSWSLIEERRQRLEQWVSDGGRLVVSGLILNDKEFGAWTGVRQLPVAIDQNKSLTCPATTRPLTTPSTLIAGNPNTLRQRFCICSNTFWWGRLTTTRKVAWELEDIYNHLQVVRIPIGRGSVTIINTQSFGNLDLLCSDSGRLFAAAAQLRRGDEIDFLTDGRGGSLLQLLWTYGSPVIVLGALIVALWLWRSSVRFGPLAATSDPARRSLAEQIRGTGQFTLRFGGGRALYTATLRALNEAAARDVPHYERLSGEERVTTLAALTGLNASELSTALDYTGTRGPHELHKAMAILETARRLVATRAHIR